MPLLRHARHGQDAAQGGAARFARENGRFAEQEQPWGDHALKPTLIFGYGNPGRGDDGLGPAFIEAVESMNLPDVACLTDMQLQVEHMLDMQGREFVLFVDADVSCREPFEFDEIEAVKDNSYTSHAVSPQSLLHAYRQTLGNEPPPCFLLRIRGYDFELGDDLSGPARLNLEKALSSILPRLRVAEVA